MTDYIDRLVAARFSIESLCFPSGGDSEKLVRIMFELARAHGINHLH
jgi:hypothetical protein